MEWKSTGARSSRCWPVRSECSQTIAEALAQRRGSRHPLECDDLASLDTVGIASRLAAAIKDRKKRPDLITLGCNADDLGWARLA